MHLLLLSPPYLQTQAGIAIQEIHFQIVLPMLVITDATMVAYNRDKNNNNEQLFLKFCVSHNLLLCWMEVDHRQ